LAARDGLDEGVTAVAVKRSSSVVDQRQLAGG
jgi:hypothetical protein